MASGTGAGIRLLNSPVRRMIVDFLAGSSGDEAPVEMTAAQLADLLELHVTTTRFHLDQLVAAGILEADFLRVGVGRPRKIYRQVVGSLQDDTDQHAMRILTELLADSFAAQVDGEDLTPYAAGRRWAEQHIVARRAARATTPGAWLAKVGQVIDVLRDWGYTPRLLTSESGRTAELQLAHCPFLELAKTNPAVVCQIHRGLIAGALEQFGEDDADVSLEPFVGPHHCLAHVTTRAQFTSGSSRATARPKRPRRKPSRTKPRSSTPSKETA